MSRTGTLQEIAPLHPPLLPDKAWEIAGTAPGNRVLYREKSLRSRGMPELSEEGQKIMAKLRERYPDNPNGMLSAALTSSKEYRELRRSPHRIWKLHPVNKEPLYSKNVLERFTLDRTFFLESEGNGQVGKVFWNPPTPEELAALERDDKIREMGRTFAAKLVDSGMTADEMIERLMSGTAIQPVTAEQEEEIRKTGTIAEPPEVVDEGPLKTLVDGVEYPEDDVEYPQLYAPGRYRLSNGDKMQSKKTEAEAAELAVMQAREDAEKERAEARTNANAVGDY